MWNYEHYGGRAVKLNPNDVWIPDVMFINSVDNFEHLKEVTILPVRSVKYSPQLPQTYHNGVFN